MHAAIGGSTNSIVHLLAIAGRLGIELALGDFDRLASGVPLLADLQPSGRYLMEDFHYAGGMPALMAHIEQLLHLDAETVDGRCLGAIVEAAATYNAQVIRSTTNAVCADSGVWVIRGNICPDGAVIKPNAASPALLCHEGRAVVFENIEDYAARIDDPALDVDASCVLVLKGCGPKGYPGMPEVGNMALPKKLLKQGVRDMVRISDARMSGTAFGTVVLHAAPETEAGGPLGLVETGDRIKLDAANRRLDADVTETELKRRAARRSVGATVPTRGYARLYYDRVQQADKGCDFDFLVGASGADVARESH